MYRPRALARKQNTTDKRERQQFKLEGFVIDSIFGSYARGEHSENSDVDILYHLEQGFHAQHIGFATFKRLQEIKESIAGQLGKNIDLAPSNNLSGTAKQYILPEVLHV